jgi:hypothetical protein
MQKLRQEKEVECRISETQHWVGYDWVIVWRILIGEQTELRMSKK